MNRLGTLQTSSTSSFSRSLSDLTAETPFLLDLFRQLDKANVKYCVLRNYEGLPYDLRGSDLDIQVAPDHVCYFLRAVREAATAHGGRSVSFSARRSMLQICLCGLCDSRWWGVRVDALVAQTYKGVAFYDSDAILAHAIRRGGVSVAEPSDMSKVALLKDMLNRGRVQDKYLEVIRRVETNAGSGFAAGIQPYFGQRTVSLLRKFVFGMSDVSLKVLCKKLRSDLAMRRLVKHPGVFFSDRLASIVDRARRIFSYPGFCVAVIGTDGSGKSTLIEEVRPVIEKACHSPLIYEHLRPNLLPSLARIFRRPIKEGPTTEPHAGRPSGFLGSLVRLSYYTIDYFAGYWVKVFPTTVKRSCVYVFDRYFYDYYVDSRRSRISLPRWIIKIFGLFVPRPDIILCLGADPARIHERKPELPLEEIHRQTAALRQFCNKNKRAVWIDTGCSIEDSVNQALEAITSRMAARYE